MSAICSGQLRDRERGGEGRRQWEAREVQRLDLLETQITAEMD